MVPVGELPVIEILLKWMRRWGIKEAYIITGYLGHLIREHCNDGCQFDMKRRYIKEPEPLGTIGALRLLDGWLNETFFTINGDLFTNLNEPLVLRPVRSGWQLPDLPSRCCSKKACCILTDREPRPLHLPLAIPVNTARHEAKPPGLWCR